MGVPLMDAYLTNHGPKDRSSMAPTGDPHDSLGRCTFGISSIST